MLKDPISPMQTSSSDFLEEERSLAFRSTPTFGTASWRILHPVSQLCSFCQNLPKSSEDYLSFYFFEPGPLSERRTFLSLQVSAEAGCVLCQLVWRKVITWLHLIDQEIFNADQLLLEVAVSLNADRLYVCTYEGLNLSRQSFDVALYRTEKNDQVYSNECRRVKSLAKGGLAEDLRSMVEEEILPWLHSCDAQQSGHENCGRILPGGIIPKRLIQVSKLQDNVVKLVETTTAAHIFNEQYLILSYCWGQGNSQARTTIRNLKQRLNGFCTQTLPQTIQDAINLTRLMEFEFLWIDAICIIQSSEGDTGDFEDEALKMRDYYANAACCICASLASDSSQGLFRERIISKFPISEVALEFLDASNTYASPVVFKIAPEDIEHLEEAIKESPLMERGWCMQELLLSRRILHWTVQGLFRECQTSLFLEGDSRSCVGFHHGYFAEEYPRRIMSPRHPPSLTSANWYRLLESFSRRHLTFLRDRHFAVQGIAALFMQHIEGEYTHGIFRSSLVQGLSWESLDWDSPTLSEDTSNGDLGFPTWSWASNGAINMSPLVTECPTIYEDFQLRTAKQGTINDSSDVEAKRKDYSQLFVKAPLIPITLNSRDPVWVASIGHKHVDKEEAWEALRMPDNNRSIELFRSPHTMEGLRSENEPHDVIVQWMPLGTTQSKEYFGLMLEKSNTGDQTTYFRYGCMVLIDHSSISDPNDAIRIEDFYNTLTEIVLV